MSQVGKHKILLPMQCSGVVAVSSAAVAALARTVCALSSFPQQNFYRFNVTNGTRILLCFLLFSKFISCFIYCHKIIIIDLLTVCCIFASMRTFCGSLQFMWTRLVQFWVMNSQGYFKSFFFFFLITCTFDRFWIIPKMSLKLVWEFLKHNWWASSRSPLV